jgi:hypothetical protein
MDVSVLIVAFNRPDLTARVFDKVRDAQPGKLFLCVDAPRDNRADDVEKNEAVKRIFEKVDWECEVHRNYAKQNLGCDPRIVSGIDWAFEYTDSLIIFEDDCVPDLTFFTFCQELLVRYKDDPRVGMIAGHIEHLLPMAVEDSYYVDRMNTIWGWATWKRAWKKFDFEMKQWPEVRDSHALRKVAKTKYQERQLAYRLNAQYAKDNRCWDAAWWLTCLIEDFLCIHPSLNLVTNIGCGNADATHTIHTTPWSNVPITPMRFPLTHPERLVPNVVEEQKTINYQYAPLLVTRIKNKLLRIVGAIS